MQGETPSTGNSAPTPASELLQPDFFTNNTNILVLMNMKLAEGKHVAAGADKEKGHVGEIHKVVFYKETAFFFSCVSKHNN